MWNVFTIPSQRELLLQELQTVVGLGMSVTTNEVVSLVQPTNGEVTSKKSKPSPFYLSLIIGDKILHNCMIDSRASISTMPRCVVDQLGMKYEPVINHVLQLDGTLVTTIGILKGLKIALHEFPSCTVIQAISIVDLSPHFAIYLSREFTAKIGGYIASD